MKTIDLDGYRIATVDEGAGDVLLLVHGFPLDHTMWLEQVADLKADYRVVAPDLRGFGNNVEATEPLTMDQHADDLARLLDQLDIDSPVHFCGLSMGGYVAWEFWRRHRDRVRSLLLCDTRAGDDTAEAAEGRLAMAERVLNEGNAFAVDAMLPKLVAPRELNETPRELNETSSVAQRLRQMIEKTSPASIASAQRGMAQRIDAQALLSDIDVPTLVVVGEHDAITTAAEMRDIAQAIPRSTFVEIPAAGHMAPLEEPAAVNRALREFLARA